MNRKFKKMRVSLLSVGLCLALIVSLFSIVVAAPATALGLSPETDLEEIVLNKTATDNGDGTFTLNLESYVTGNVIWEEQEIETPSDIILVLDQSGSMGYDFEDRSTSDDTKRRQYALKQAVNKFIKDIAGRYNAETSDHRIAIVTYDDSASTFNSRTPLMAANSVDPNDRDPSDGNYLLVNQINSLPADPSGATRTDLGLNAAAKIFAGDTYYSGPNPEGRHRAVVLFTDGSPTSSDSFELTVATNAIASALTLKKQYGALVFSIGIFEGAESTNTYGSNDYFRNHGLTKGQEARTDCEIFAYSDGSVGSQWLIHTGWEASHNEQICEYMPASNRFLNFVSSNYPSAAAIGLKRAETTHRWGFLQYYSYSGYEVTTNYIRDANRYYLTAKDADQLSASFETISKWIKSGGTTVELTEKAVVKDIISPYFELPDSVVDEKDISVHVAACTGFEDGKYTFGPLQDVGPGTDFPLVKATIKDYETDSGDRRNISVTGFNFTEYYVGYDEISKKPCGYELVISFLIKPIEGFSGGNDVPTNNPESGIYESENGDPIKEYPQPEVNIPLIEPAFTFKLGNDLVIYQGNKVPIDAFFVIGAEDPILDHFVERKVCFKGVEMENGLFSPQDTTCYEKFQVVVTLTPKTLNPSTDVGDKALPVMVSNQEDFTIYVLKPTVSVAMNDVTKFFGDTYALTDQDETIGVTWKDADGHTTGTEDVEGVVCPFVADDLTVDYTAEGYSGIVPKTDVTVTATARFADEEKAETPIPATISYTTSCDTCASRTDGTYIIHAQSASLTIQNKGGETNEAFVYTVFKDGTPFMKVSLAGSGSGGSPTSLTIIGLSAGAYTVVPDTAWNWRYTSKFTGNKDSETVTLNADNLTASVVCTNTKTNSSWVGNVSQPKVNTYGKGA